MAGVRAGIACRWSTPAVLILTLSHPHLIATMAVDEAQADVDAALDAIATELADIDTVAVPELTANVAHLPGNISNFRAIAEGEAAFDFGGFARACVYLCLCCVFDFGGRRLCVPALTHPCNGAPSRHDRVCRDGGCGCGGGPVGFT